MRAAPTAFRLRVFTEPPPLFLGLRAPPIHFLAGVPAGRAGSWCPVISQKTMTGAPLDRRLQAKTTSASRSPTPPWGPGADPAGSPVSGGPDGRRPAGGAGSLPAFLPRTPEGPQTVPVGKPAWGAGDARASFAAGAPSDLPQVLH